MKVYGLFAFMLSVFERQRDTSRLKVEFVRSGDRRRGIGDARVVAVCEGILIVVYEVTRDEISTSYGFLDERTFVSWSEVLWKEYSLMMLS